MLIDMLPLAVLLVGLHLEVSKKVSFHLLLVKKVIAFVDDGLESTAAQSLGFLAHAVVIIPFSLILRLGVDVDAEGFMAHDLHCALVPVARVIVQIEGQLFSAFDLPCAEGHGLTNVAHSTLFIICYTLIRYQLP